MAEELVINAEQGGDTQAHIDAMVAKAGGTEIETPDPVGDDPNAAVKAAPNVDPEGETNGDPEGEPNVDPEVADEGEAEAVLEAAGINVEDALASLAADGSLTDEQYAKLAEIGVTRAVVDSFVAGQQAMGEAMVARMHETVGGEQALNDILSWAGDNLPASEVEQFNQTIDAGSETAVKMALKGLQMRYNEAGQNAPTLVGGQQVDSVSTQFRSTAELTKAMGDPRYATDAAYRADVEAKLLRSSIF
jgi:hypothetical protein